MTWLGIIRDTTDVDPRPGVSHVQFNTRMQVANELQRRWGYLSSAIAKQSGPILGIASANGANGNFVTFDLGASTQGFTGTGSTGIDVLPPQPPGPKKRKPKGDRGTCTIWGPFSDGGTAGVSSTFMLPAGSCPGTVHFTSAEAGGSGGSGGGSDYGYSVTVLADGVAILTSGCVVNDGSTGVIPAGALVLSYTVTAGCAGGAIPGSWSISATTP